MTTRETLFRRAQRRSQGAGSHLLDEYFCVDGCLGQLGLHFRQRLLLAHEEKTLRAEFTGAVATEVLVTGEGEIDGVSRSRLR